MPGALVTLRTEIYLELQHLRSHSALLHLYFILVSRNLIRLSLLTPTDRLLYVTQYLSYLRKGFAVQMVYNTTCTILTQESTCFYSNQTLQQLISVSQHIFNQIEKPLFQHFQQYFFFRFHCSLLFFTWLHHPACSHINLSLKSCPTSHFSIFLSDIIHEVLWITTSVEWLKWKYDSMLPASLALSLTLTHCSGNIWQNSIKPLTHSNCGSP